MSRFSHYAKYGDGDVEVFYDTDLPPKRGEEDKVPTFIVKYMGPTNKKFKAESKRVGPELSRLENKKHRSQKDDDRYNEIQFELIAKTVIVGWENFYYDDGTKADFSYENVLELLKSQAKRGRLVQDLVTFVMNDRNFPSPDEDGEVIDEEDVKNVVGESETTLIGNSNSPQPSEEPSSDTKRQSDTST